MNSDREWQSKELLCVTITELHHEGSQSWCIGKACEILRARPSGAMLLARSPTAGRSRERFLSITAHEEVLNSGTGGGWGWPAVGAPQWLRWGGRRLQQGKASNCGGVIAVGPRSISVIDLVVAICVPVSPH